VVEVEVLVVVVTNVVVDVADLVQDAKTRDVITRKVSTIQAIPLFIQTPLLFWNNSGTLLSRQIFSPPSSRNSS